MAFISNGFTYFAVLVFIAGAVSMLESKYGDRSFFKYVPAPVAIYLVSMLCASLGIFDMNQEVNNVYSSMMAILLPAMVFLMLLRCDITKLIDLGPKMMLGFLSASATIVVGFIVMFTVLRDFFPPEAWKMWSALASSWIGGSGNMLIMQSRLGIEESEMMHTFMVDNISYAVWFLVLLASVPFAGRFNKWTKASTRLIDEMGGKLAKLDERASAAMKTPDLIFIMGIALLASALATSLAYLVSPSLIETMGRNDLFTPRTLSVILVTLFGVIAALSPVKKIPGSQHVSMSMLYIMVAVTGSRAQMSNLGQAPLYLLAGFMILAVHAALMLLIAKILKIDLFTCTVASLSNIGAIVGAPILAAAYKDSLIPVGILMSLMGYVIGTFGGIFVSNILSIIAGG